MKKKLIESAGGVVVRKTKKGFYTILLYKNGHWVLPKGRIERGESKKKTALREIHEETGIPLNKIKIVTKLGTINYIVHQSANYNLSKPKVVTYFLVKTSYKRIKPLKGDGFQKASWINLNRAFHKVTFSNNKAIILKAIKYLNSEYLNRINIAVIAVGGKGQRIISLSKNRSKLLFLFEGEPFLKYLLDIVLKCKFKKLYLLTSYHHKEIKKFIKKFYPKTKKIQIIYGDKKGRKEGAPTVLYKIKNLIKNPFIYIDGNIIFQPSLLKKLTSKHLFNKSIIKLVISSSDLAPTHLRILIKNNKIHKIIPRIVSYSKIRTNKNYFFSMGIMAIDYRIFDLLSDFNKFRDLDLLIEFLFKTKLNTDIDLIDFFKYNNTWYCIHMQKDIKLIEQKGKKFLCSLKT